MIGRLTLHNLYKVKISEALGKISARPVLSTEISISHAMTACTSKSAADLFTWYYQLAYRNEASVKQLSTMVSGIKIV